MSLTPSMEDYLEAIFEIDQVKLAVRVKDVAEKLGVTMPSVNGALKNLEANGYIKHEKYEYIELTGEGIVHAKKIWSRHKTLFRFLTVILGVSPETAENEACRIEHVLSQDTIYRLETFLDTFETTETSGEKV